MDYKEALEFLYSLQRFGIKFGLNATKSILDALGNPHMGRRFVHVAGSNGKGSVCTYINFVLMEAGYRVGFYSSPHLVSFRERFKINWQDITEKEIVRLVEKIQSVLKDGDLPTFFEFTTAMALDYFRAQSTDIDIIEVGMGGRLDATNVIKPLVGLITNISLEHQEYLGKTLRRIAEEKAGIIKDGMPLVTGVTQRSVKDVIERAASSLKSTVYLMGREFRVKRHGDYINYYGLGLTLKDIELGLKGGFQSRNAGLALCALELLKDHGLNINEEAIYRGLKKATWPGRYHFISERPKILLDGAHNPDAMRKLAMAVKGLSFQRLILVIGIMGDKEIDRILRTIVPMSDSVIFTRPKYYRAAPPEKLSEIGSNLAKESYVIDELADAIKKAKEMAMEQDLILITGSLFTVGEALAILDPKTYIPDPV